MKTFSLALAGLLALATFANAQCHGSAAFGYGGCGSGAAAFGYQQSFAVPFAAPCYAQPAFVQSSFAYSQPAFVPFATGYAGYGVRSFGVRSFAHSAGYSFNNVGFRSRVFVGARAAPVLVRPAAAASVRVRVRVR